MQNVNVNDQEVILSGYAKEFRDALKDEIEEIKKKNHKIYIFNGNLIKKK